MAHRTPLAQNYQSLGTAPQRRPNRQSLTDWVANHFRGYSELEAYNLATGKRQTVAEIMGDPQVDAEQVAEFMTTALLQFEPARTLIAHMADALEKCIDCKKAINWDAEHEADIMIRNARAFLAK